MSLQRSEQKGKLGSSSSDSISNRFEQIGHWPRIMSDDPFESGLGFDSVLGAAGVLELSPDLVDDSLLAACRPWRAFL